MTTKFQIRKEDSLSNTIVLPEICRNQSDTIPDWVAFSSRRLRCRIYYENEDTVKVSEDLWKKLGIPHESICRLVFHDSTVFLGPVIGIFTAGFTDQHLRPIGERSRFFAKFLSVSEDVGAYCYVFGYHHIHWEEGTIDGFFYGKDGWRKQTVPFPDVVYDRLPNRRTERLSRYRTTKQKLQDQYFIPWFNPGFFDKWRIHKLLNSDHQASQYLPITHENPTQDLIESMLNTYRHVYLKPAKGSLGIGIHQILKRKDKTGYFCRFYDGESSRLRRFESLDSLLRQQLSNGKLEHLLLQQGIDLLQWDHRSVDFRVHTNKDDEGNWVVSTIAAKAAGSGSVTTHIKYGGEVKMIEEIFGEGSSKDHAIAKLKQAALIISSVIDQKMEGIIGEIGFDLGIDRGGQVWLFEANAKPGRHIFIHPHLKKADELSRKLPLAFAVFLARDAIMKTTATYA